jgi:hypothetical protein
LPKNFSSETEIRKIGHLLEHHAVVEFYPFGVQDDEHLAGGVGESSPADQADLLQRSVVLKQLLDSASALING